MKKVLVSLPDGVIEILDKNIIGKLGEGYSDSLRQIILNWLSEQGYLAKDENKNKDNILTGNDEPQDRVTAFLRDPYITGEETRDGKKIDKTK